MATEARVLETGRASPKNWNLGQVPTLLYAKLGFEPTGEEQARILRAKKRFELVTGGGQSGKSLVASKKWIKEWAEDVFAWPDEMLLYWLVAKDYNQTRAEFDYIAADLIKLGQPVRPGIKRVDPGLIEVKYKGEGTPRLRIETKSAKDPRTLSMFAPHGIIICEAGQVDLETYMRCLERLGPKRGWLFMSGTLESGSLGWYPALSKAWAHGTKDEQSFTLPKTSNWHLFPGGENDPEILRLKANSSDDFYMERVMGVAAPPKGLVLREFRPDIHIREIEYNPDLPIYIWDDPGYGHAHAIEIAQIHQEGHVHILDEIYERGIITESLIKDDPFCMHRYWWKNPNKKLVIDPNYANQHPAQKSIAELWLAETGLVAYGMKISIMDGLERFKSFLRPNPITGKPRITFDPKCKGVLSELGAYPNPFDGQVRVYTWEMDREGNVVGDKPRDRYNDGIKAITYGLCEEYGILTTTGKQEFVMTRYNGKWPAKASLARSLR